MFNAICLNNIRNLDTRKYFQDTLQAYYSKNYRAAIILLYTTTVFDLIEKMYNMNEKKYINATTIIKKIEESKKKEEKKLSEIEDEVFNFYLKRDYFNDDVIDDLKYLRNARNRCAHPTFYIEGLYCPTEEQVYMLLKRMMDNIFTVEYIIKNPIDLIKDDIDKMDNDWFSEEIGVTDRNEEIKNIKKAFQQNHYNYLTDERLKKLLNDLFELSIVKKNSETELRQYKTFLVLESLIDYLFEMGESSILLSTFKFDKVIVSEVRDNIENDYGGWRALKYLLIMIKRKKELLTEIEASNFQLFEFLLSSIKSPTYLDDFWDILFCDRNEYLALFLLQPHSFMRTYKFYEKNESYINKEQKIQILLNLFSSVPKINAYNQADSAMKLLLQFINKYNPLQVEIDNFLEIMNENRQFYDLSRKQSINDFRELESLGIKIDDYEKLLETIK